LLLKTAVIEMVRNSPGVRRGDTGSRRLTLGGRHDRHPLATLLIWAVMTVWRTRGKIIRTVQCCIVYHNCTQL